MTQETETIVVDGVIYKISDLPKNLIDAIALLQEVEFDGEQLSKSLAKNRFSYAGLSEQIAALINKLSADGSISGTKESA